MKEKYLYIGSEDLATEREQLLDEGKDISLLEAEFQELFEQDLDDDLSLQPRAEKLLDETIQLPLRAGYPYREPSDLESIREARPESLQKMEIKLDEGVLFDKVLGAWLGRCSGCLLGKPVEGWRIQRIWGYLRDLGRYPLDDYFTSAVPAEIATRYDVVPNIPRRTFIDRVEHMPEDDDTNYTVLGLKTFKEYGPAFTPENVATSWLTSLPILRTFTAERVVYRTLSHLIPPPESAIFRNPYREWIGAQIRADFFGYVALGEPELAAEFAWRDASVSHIKNGIYGDMWVAAMLATAAAEVDIQTIIESGLAQIPAGSRLAEAIQEVIDWHEEGIDFEEAISRIHARWDEGNRHHWCHTISNAQIVALGLLWDDRDFEKSICRAVQAGFDTDCNGATVGSIIGMILGAEKLPEKWIGPLNDTLETGVAGYGKAHISGLAREGFELYKARVRAR